MDARDVVDAMVEFPVVTSFTRLGYDIRSRVEHWAPTSRYDLRGRVMLVTGATSGIGLAAATALADDGATVVLLGRNPEKTARSRRSSARARATTAWARSWPTWPTSTPYAPSRPKCSTVTTASTCSCTMPRC